MTCKTILYVIVTRCNNTVLPYTIFLLSSSTSYLIPVNHVRINRDCNEDKGNISQCNLTSASLKKNENVVCYNVLFLFKLKYTLVLHLTSCLTRDMYIQQKKEPSVTFNYIQKWYSKISVSNLIFSWGKMKLKDFLWIYVFRCTRS